MFNLIIYYKDGDMDKINLKSSSYHNAILESINFLSSYDNWNHIHDYFIIGADEN